MPKNEWRKYLSTENSFAAPYVLLKYIKVKATTRTLQRKENVRVCSEYTNFNRDSSILARFRKFSMVEKIKCKITTFVIFMIIRPHTG